MVRVGTFGAASNFDIEIVGTALKELCATHNMLLSYQEWDGSPGCTLTNL